MKSYALAALLALSTTVTAALPALAEGTELSQPIIALTGVLAKNADALALTDDQRVALKAWLDVAPAKRKQVETEVIAQRAALRAAIIAGAPVTEREAMAKQIGATEAQLIMMRSNCTDHWRAVLTADQFAQLVTLATAK